MMSCRNGGLVDFMARAFLLNGCRNFHSAEVSRATHPYKG